MSGLLSNAISGLQASQNALRTAGHNIANADTTGFSRQEVKFESRPGQYIGNSGFIGSGVNTVAIERVIDDFVTKQLRTDTSAFNQLNSYHSYITKIDSLLADTQTGLNANIENFFNAVQSANNDPSASSSRQLVINQANALSSKFHNLFERIDEVQHSVNSDIASVASQITSLAKNIASLNQAIGEASASANSQKPNDLLDKRDQALLELSTLTSIQTHTSSNGDINVSVGSGQALVMGNISSSMSVERDGRVQISSPAGAFTLSTEIMGGKIGGLMRFRDEVIAPSLNQLGLVAITLADEMNRLQSQGIDLEGQFGSPLFTDINSDLAIQNRVSHAATNASPQDRIMTVTIDDTSKLSGSDYRFKIIPNTLNYVITRENDDTIVNQGMLSGSYPVSLSFDGITVNLQSGSFQGGDSFTIQPTRQAAKQLDVIMTRPEDLALASPLRTATSASNSGSGQVDLGQVLSTTGADGKALALFAKSGQLSPPMIIRFTSSTTYEVLDNSDPANLKPLTPPMAEQTFTPGINNKIFSENKGETLIEGKGTRVGLPQGRTATSGLTAGVSMSNQYLAEQLRFTTTSPNGSVSTQALTTSAGASAAQTANLLNSLPGVTANAYTTATINNLSIAPADAGLPTQISLNGVNLLGIANSGTEYLDDVPDLTDAQALNDYLAKQINNNSNLAAQGIRAVSTTNPLTGAAELNVVSSTGENLDIRLLASNASSLDVKDALGNPNVRLTGSNAGGGEQTGVLVGGKIDLVLAEGKSLETAPTDSPLFGDSTAQNFSQSNYRGIQVTISGQPAAGDVFTIGFNIDAANDNRNGANMVALQTQGITNGGSRTIGQTYTKLVEDIGTKSNLSKINSEASKSLLLQTQSTRDGISGVNLDEEAAHLIQFQQMYQANAQVISVARQLFDTLLNSM